MALFAHVYDDDSLACLCISARCLAWLIFPTNILNWRLVIMNEADSIADVYFLEISVLSVYQLSRKVICSLKQGIFRQREKKKPDIRCTSYSFFLRYIFDLSWTFPSKAQEVITLLSYCLRSFVLTWAWAIIGTRHSSLDCLISWGYEHSTCWFDVNWSSVGLRLLTRMSSRSYKVELEAL